MSAAHSFTNRLINVKGGLERSAPGLEQPGGCVQQHDSVRAVAAGAVRVPHAGRGAGAVTLTATVKYRRFNQHFIDFGMSKHYEQPVVDMASQTRTCCRSARTSRSRPEADENKEWMRWNNYGIALLDAQQYAALRCMRLSRWRKLRPDYADAYTNIAIVQTSSGRSMTMRGRSLQKALALAPGNARALYYRALVERNEGNLDAAIADLQAVAESFPQSRDAHRELGFSYYQQHNTTSHSGVRESAGDRSG